jgi:MFS family permease
MAAGLGETVDRPMAGARLNTRHIFAATLGNGLEFYDFITYAFFAIPIGKAFFPTSGSFASLMLSLATFGAGFLTRPIGALVIGRYADTAGRRPAMVLSFALMGASVVALALIPPYAVIGLAAPVLAVLARLAQGFALGGEVGSNTAFLAEAADPRHRGLATSLQGLSQTIASLIGAMVGLLLSLALPHAALDAYGWRIAFLIGGLTLPAGLWLRRSLPETLHQPEGEGACGARLRPGIVVLCFLALGNLTITTYARNYMTTFAQGSLHLAAPIAFAASVTPGLASIVGGLFGAWLSDRIGRRPVLVVGSLAATICTPPLFAWIVAERTPFALLAGAALIALASTPAAAALYPALSESMPKASRGQAVALTYALAIAIFGGTAQLVFTWLIHATGNLMAPAWYMTAANVVGLGALWFLPETAPVKLQAAERLRSA